MFRSIRALAPFKIERISTIVLEIAQEIREEITREKWCWYIAPVFGHLLNILILLAAVVYAFGMIIWIHAPVTGVVEMIAIAALVPLAVAWGTRRCR
jgi:Na+/pantothenate symporter